MPTKSPAQTSPIQTWRQRHREEAIVEPNDVRPALGFRNGLQLGTMFIMAAVVQCQIRAIVTKETKHGKGLRLVLA
jgi:hypothetical protein